MNEIKAIAHEHGTDNIFADLGLADAAELHRRARIGFYVFQLIKDRNLKQREAAQLLKIAQPDVSHLMNGHFSRFTTDKLLDFLNLLDQKVIIQIRPRLEGEPREEIGYAA